MFKPIHRPIVCKDGTTLSVQASSNHYSMPREDKADFYTHVEVGFPSIPPPDTWLDYADSGKGKHSSVYGYVPVELVQAFIDEHGGIDISKLL